MAASGLQRALESCQFIQLQSMTVIAEISSEKTTQLMFQDMVWDDLWPDAQLTAVVHYTRASKKLKLSEEVPPASPQ